MRSARRVAVKVVGLTLALLAASLDGGRLRAAELGIDRDEGPVRLTLKGEDGKEYSVEAIESLLNQGAVWKSIATVAPGDRPQPILDPTCTTRPQSFYRLRLLANGIPVEVPNFRLIDLEGRTHELFYQSDAAAVVLVFTGPDLATLGPQGANQLEHLRSLRADAANQNVRFWIITETSGTDRTALKAAATALGIDFTVLVDEGGAVTRQIVNGAAPEAVLLEPGAWSVRYRGRIRDVVSVDQSTAVQPLLATALQSVLTQKPVVVRQSAVDGSPLAAADFSAKTYAKDIAPLLQTHCVKCHSPGNIAPWAMTNHTVVHDFAPMMKDEILTRRMPPWHADRQPRAYSNDEMMSGEQTAMLIDWIDRGAPRGDGGDPLAASVPPLPPAWPIGQPDQVLSIPSQSIPASGTVDYRYLVVANPFPNDVWLRAAAVKPGNAKVLHHVLVFSATSFADVLQIQGGLGGYFAAYVPGMDQVPFPAGTGKFLKRGAFLVFQVHYTATGKPETDQTQLGLYLAPVKPASELKTGAAYNTSFTIPANDADAPGSAEFTLPVAGTLYEMSPHMHYRGSWFKFEAVYPDNRREVLLNVPFYRFNWQTLYRLQEPKQLPAGTRIVTTGGWDNSARNPYNPDPSINVAFGEQSWEEMFIGYFNWSPNP